MKKHINYMYVLLFMLSSMSPIIARAQCLQPFVDLLAWRANETNTAWATTFTFPNNTTQVTQSTINFNTRAGLRAGLSYSADNNFFDTKFYWTYFPSSITKSLRVGDKLITSLFFSGSFFISENLFFGASANWELVMNMFDLEVSHHFKPTPSLTFTPRVGVKGGSINQTIKATWDAILYTSTERVTNNFTGIGPSFGVNAKWNVYQCLSVIADVSTAFLYGRWNGNDIYKRPSAFFGLITPTTISTRMHDSKLGTLMMDYFLGLEWIHQGRSRVTVQLGYEMQYWANQLRLITVQQLPTLGDLTIQGATCEISIDL